MKIEGSIEEMISNLFQNCDVYFEDVNVNCDREHVLNGNLAISSFILSTWEKIEVVEDVCASPAEYLKELTRVFKKSRKFRRLTREYIWKKITKSSKMHYYIMCFMMLTRFVNVRVHVNTGAKGNLVTWLNWSWSSSNLGWIVDEHCKLEMPFLRSRH